MRTYAEDMPKAMEMLAQKLAGPLDGPLGAVGIVIQEGLAENFSSESGADGTIWPDRKGEDELGHPILIETGALLAAATGTGAGSIHRVANGRTLEVGVDKSTKIGGVPGAGVHNFGHPPFNIPYNNPGGNREWCYASSATADKAVVVLADTVLKEVFS